MIAVTSIFHICALQCGKTLNSQARSFTFLGRLQLLRDGASLGAEARMHPRSWRLGGSSFDCAQDGLRACENRGPPCDPLSPTLCKTRKGRGTPFHLSELQHRPAEGRELTARGHILLEFKGPTTDNKSAFRTDFLFPLQAKYVVSERQQFSLGEERPRR